MLRLPPVNEDESVEVSTHPDAQSSAANRKRLVSTASSRFFPGGWFSPTSKPEEGRTSMEIASGEFTPLKSPVDGPNVPPPTPVVGLAAEEEKRSRLCVIM